MKLRRNDPYRRFRRRREKPKAVSTGRGLRRVSAEAVSWEFLTIIKRAFGRNGASSRPLTQAMLFT